MKTIKRIAVSALALLTVGAAFPACGPKKGSEPVKDPKTINVKLLTAGYGTSWLQELEAKFEAAYEAEGYQVNILAPSSDVRGTTVLSELAMGYDTMSIDLYVTGDIQSAAVGTQNDYKKGTALVEETEELVYNQKPIRFDRTEEDVKVKDKLSGNMNEWLQDLTSYNSDKKYYGVPYVASSAGLVVNTKKLAKYGYTEAPRTSQEIIDMGTDIYLGNDANGNKGSDQTDVYPFTYFNNPNNAGGYGITWMYSMIAQYDYETFMQLLEWTKAEGDTRVEMELDGYKVYQHDAVKQALEFMYFVYDPILASSGSTNQTMDAGQASIMKSGGAVFMANGDWMLNEVRLSYKNTLGDIDFVNYPVNSYIGKEEFGKGSALNLSDADADKLLSYIIKLVDENKEISAIIEDVKTNKNYDVSEASVKRVAEARGLNYSRGIESQCFIPKGSTKKDIAALFLRMMASDDAAELFAKEANGTSAFAKGVNQYTTHNFVKHASEIAVNRYAKPYRWFTGGLRKRMMKGSMFCEGGSDILTKIYLARGNTMFSTEASELLKGKDFSVYTDAAVKLQTAEYTFAANNWSEWLEAAIKKQ